MNKPCIKLTKTVQKRVYDFLLTKYGITLICVSFLLILLSIIHLSETLVEYRIERLKSLTESFAKNLNLNLNSKHFIDENVNNAVDCVYTWVNGSDPEHIKKLYEAKKNFDLHTATKTQRYLKLEWPQLIAKLTNQTDHLLPCFHKLCMQTHNLVVIRPQLSQIDLKVIFAETEKLFGISSLTIENIDELSLLSLHFKPDQTNLNQLNELFKTYLFSKRYQAYAGFYTIDSNCDLGQSCLKDLKRTFIMKKIKKSSSSNYELKNLVHNRFANSNSSSVNLFMELPTELNGKLEFKLDYIHVAPKIYDGSNQETNQKKATATKEADNSANSAMSNELSVIRVKSIELDKYFSKYLMDSSDMSSDGHFYTFLNVKENKNVSYDIYRAHVAYDLGDPLAEDFAAHRFQDNDELKYSLRSLEKYAPWIRNVYIVTNGQVPHWLNLTNPRIRLVTHEQIFPNKSHLPTFSSPAIESHLHRIKGLSSRFIYLNDDYLLAKPVYFDDFYTQSNGFRINLAWSLPGCNLNCPQSWIRDGYCDKACNTSECDFDGGDCDPNKTNRNNMYNSARLAIMNQSQIVYPDFYCATGCSTSWLADKYCDNACNFYNCGYDMGDCGVADLYEKAYGLSLNLTANILPTLKIPRQTLVFYVNLTLADGLTLADANYEETKSVRTISFVNKFKILTVLLMPSALNNTLPELVNIVLNLKNKTFNMNTTMSFLINSFEVSSTLPTNNQTKPVSSSLKFLTSSTTKPSKKLKKIDIEPVLSNHTNLDLLPHNLDNIYPENFKFSNNYLNQVYQNYYDYLNWSLANGYLSEIGFRYKLFTFYTKLTNEINSSYSHLVSELNNRNLNETNSQLNELVLNILFNNKTSILNDFDKDVLIGQFLNETNNNSFFRRRVRRDTFADSLRYVNRLFNQIYGYMPRKVPAHAPHLIDREIMNRLENKFKTQFELTSSHRLRSSNDMQYAFSYYYFIMSELDEFNASKLFEEFDINENNLLDETEMAIINFKLNSRPFSTSNVGTPASEMFHFKEEFLNHLNDCKLNTTEPLVNGLLNKDQFSACTGLVDYLREKLWNVNPKEPNLRSKYRYETVGDENTKFVMVAGDPLEIEVKLNNLIREPRKFVCLNDNIDYKIKHEAAELKRLIKYFYSMLFPLPSQFEKNTIDSSSSHINTLKLNLNLNLNQNNYNYFILFLVFVFLLCSMYACVRCMRCLFSANNRNLRHETLKNI